MVFPARSGRNHSFIEFEMRHGHSIVTDRIRYEMEALDKGSLR